MASEKKYIWNLKRPCLKIGSKIHEKGCEVDPSSLDKKAFGDYLADKSIIVGEASEKALKLESSSYAKKKQASK